MEYDTLVREIHNRVGYVESEHKADVMKGVHMTHTIMAKRIRELEETLEKDRKSLGEANDRLRGQLETVANIFKEHASE